jgi:branched-subunit amino acid aminotransferase/4-amino-4-deoxychorismate lyase
MDYFLNGRMVPAEQAMVSALDSGLQHAVGLFETMAARHGRVFRIEEHLTRMARSAVALGLTHQLDTVALREAVELTLRHNELDEARVRLTVTAGSATLLAPRGSSASPPPEVPPEPPPEAGQTVLVVATPPTVYDPAYFAQGIGVLVAPPLANPLDPLSGHKTLAYWGRLRTLRQAAAAGAGEAIWLNITNHLAGGAVSNLFLVKDGTVCTPLARGEEVAGALPAPVLPGITRAAVLELCAEMEVAVQRRMLTISDLLDADEVFLTNSSWQVLPVTRVEKKAIGSGAVGAVTGRLRAALLDTIEQETSA